MGMRFTKLDLVRVFWQPILLALVLILAVVMAGCGLLGDRAVKNVLDKIAPVAVDVLTKVIRDRFGSSPNEDTAVCWELPEGFQSGEDELDEEERGAFVVCWARAAE